MALHPVGQTVVDGPDLEVYRLQVPERPLHMGEALVGPHRLLRGHRLLRHRGPNDIQSVQSGLFPDLLFLPAVREGVILSGWDKRKTLHSRHLQTHLSKRVHPSCFF
jgi:hypothetical protein